MKLVLPYPVSANRYWQSFVPKGARRAIVHPSSEAKAYKRQVQLLAMAAGCRVSRRFMALSLTLCPRQNKDGSASAVVLDLGNCLKVAEDALQGVVYENDKQVQDIRLRYGAARPDGALIVEVEEFVVAPAPGELDLPPAVAEPKRDPVLGDLPF